MNSDDDYELRHKNERSLRDEAENDDSTIRRRLVEIKPISGEYPPVVRKMMEAAEKAVRQEAEKIADSLLNLGPESDDESISSDTPDSPTLLAPRDTTGFLEDPLVKKLRELSMTADDADAPKAVAGEVSGKKRFLSSSLFQKPEQETSLNTQSPQPSGLRR